MSNITEQEIEKLARNNYFIKTKKVMAENTRPDMVIGFIDGYKAALQNKVSDLSTEQSTSNWKAVGDKDKFLDEVRGKESDVSTEEIELESQRRYAILERYNNIDSFMKREAFKDGAEWHASIVNKKDNNAIEIVKKLAEWSNKYPRGITYHISKISRDEELISIEELAKKFIESQLQNSSVGVSDAIEFANFVGNRSLPEYSKSTNKWRWWNNDARAYDFGTTEELYKIFQESQPQQKEV